ncbi:MAG: hypothetical protein GTO41_05680, partial [Burkholderiales bacterium]|nr:hypothetical protein [Burkholderiales bacterium]
IVATDGERRVIDNLKQKAKHADRMFDSLLQHMQDVIAIKRSDYASYNKPVGVPTWL